VFVPQKNLTAVPSVARTNVVSVNIQQRTKFVTVPAQGGSCLPSSALAHRKQHSVKLLASLLQHSCTSTKTQIMETWISISWNI